MQADIWKSFSCMYDLLQIKGSNHGSNGGLYGDCGIPNKDMEPIYASEHIKVRESGRIAHNGSDDYWPGDNSNRGVSSSVLSSLGLNNTDQLPGAVVEARTRLLERLRGVSLAENRQCSFHYDVLHNKSTPHVDNDSSNAAFNPTIPKHLASSSTMRAESTMQIDNFTSLDLSNKKKFPNIDWDAFHMLKGEVFASGETHETGNMGSPPECCICLERFKDGDWLIKLCCSHKFHSACLEPWVRSCGDCPYCRADIAANSADDFVGPRHS